MKTGWQSLWLCPGKEYYVSPPPLNIGAIPACHAMSCLRPLYYATLIWSQLIMYKNLYNLWARPLTCGCWDCVLVMKKITKINTRGKIIIPGTPAVDPNLLQGKKTARKKRAVQQGLEKTCSQKQKKHEAARTSIYGSHLHWRRRCRDYGMAQRVVLVLHQWESYSDEDGGERSLYFPQVKPFFLKLLLGCQGISISSVYVISPGIS